MKKLTPWYPGDVKPLSDPEHVGEYQRQYSKFMLPALDYWDGCAWRDSDGYYCAYQSLPWRGMAEKPE